MGLKNNGEISRRELLALMGKTGLAGAGVALAAACKGSPTTPPPPPPPPVHSNVLVKFYNHTQGYIGEKTYSGMSDSLLAIKVSDCPNISTVDPNLIAVRESANGGWLGKLIEPSTTGQLKWAKYPGKDMEYDAFLMNNTNSADYSRIVGDGLRHSPNATWDREDYKRFGPDGPPHEAMRQIGESLKFPWAKYAQFTELPRFERGDFWVGYGTTSWPPSSVWYRGAWSELMALIDPVAVPDDTTKLRVFIEVIFGHLTFASTIAGPNAPYTYITDNNGINAIGKDLLAYSIVKDGMHVT